MLNQLADRGREAHEAWQEKATGKQQLDERHRELCERHATATSAQEGRIAQPGSAEAAAADDSMDMDSHQHERSRRRLDNKSRSSQIASKRAAAGGPSSSSAPPRPSKR